MVKDLANTLNGDDFGKVWEKCRQEALDGRSRKSISDKLQTLRENVEDEVLEDRIWI